MGFDYFDVNLMMSFECDHCEKSQTFEGFKKECFALAKKAGWKVNLGKGTCICPKCQEKSNGK